MDKPALVIPAFSSEMIDFTSDISNIFSHQHDMRFIDNNPSTPTYITFSMLGDSPWGVFVISSEEVNGAKSYKAHQVRTMYCMERFYWLGSLVNYGLSFEMVYGQLYTLYVLAKQTKGVLSENVINYIESICNTYYLTTEFDLRQFARELFYMEYYIMVSNEYYQNENGPTQLGPAVNLLGYHRLLLEQMPFDSAAVHDYGMSTEITKQEAIHRGIVLF